jgi:protein O-mannosyl-transferase
MNTSTPSLTLSQFVRYISRRWLSSLAFQRLFVVLFAVGMYAQTAFYDYATDSARLVSETQITHKGIGIDAILHLMMHDTFDGSRDDGSTFPSTEHYQPFTMFTFAAEYSLFGEDPHISHMVNISLYAFTALLLLSVINRIFKYYLDVNSRHIISFVAVLIFIAHPLHTEIVASIKGRNEILSFMWLLVMTYLLLRATYARAFTKSFLLILVSISFFLALLTETTALSFLILVPLILYFFVKLKKRDYFILGIPIALTASLYWFMRNFFLKKIDATPFLSDLLHNPLAEATIVQKISTIIYVFGKYLQLLIYPHPLSHDYSYAEIPVKEWYDPFVLSTIAIYLIAGYFAIILFRKKSIFSFAYFCFLGYLLFIYITDYVIYPNEFVFIPRGSLLTERLLYLPSLPFAMAVSYFIYQLFRHLVFTRRNRAVLVYSYTFIGTFLVVFAYGTKTILRNKDWYNKETILAADVKNTPKSVNLRMRYAYFLHEKAAKTRNKAEKNAYLREAAQQIEAAIAVYPHYVEGLTLLGDVYLRLRDIDTADSLFAKALEYNSEFARAHGGRGRVAYLRKEYEKSAQHCLQWVIFSKKNNQKDTDEAFYNLGRAYEALGSPQKAIPAYQTAVLEEPQNAKAHERMAAIYAAEDRIEEAINAYHKSIAADKYNPAVYKQLSEIYQNTGQTKKAIITLEEAIKMNPDTASLYKELGTLYQQNGDVVRAEVFFAKATVLGEKE